MPPSKWCKATELFQKPALPSSGAPSGDPPPISGAGDRCRRRKQLRSRAGERCSRRESERARLGFRVFAKDDRSIHWSILFEKTPAVSLTALQAARAAVNIAILFVRRNGLSDALFFPCRAMVSIRLRFRR